MEEPGRPALFDTRAAVLWDDEYLYVGFWLEEPDVRATYTTRDSMICEENDVEVFIAGEDTYYEFELNALGTNYGAVLRVAGRLYRSWVRRAA